MRYYNSAAAEPFLNGSSTGYIEEMYNAWLRDPASVHAVSFVFGVHVPLESIFAFFDDSDLLHKVRAVNFHRFFFFILVVGRLFPQQLIPSTSISRTSAEKSCFCISIPRWWRLVSTIGRWRSSNGRTR